MRKGLVKKTEIKKRKIEEKVVEKIEIKNQEIKNNYLGENETRKEDTEKSDYFEDCNLVIKNDRNFFSKNVYFFTTETSLLPVFINCISTAFQ